MSRRRLAVIAGFTLAVAWLLRPAPVSAALDASRLSVAGGVSLATLPDVVRAGHGAVASSLIAGICLTPNLRAELRADYMDADVIVSHGGAVDDSPLELLHTGFDLAWFPTPAWTAAPYVTGGLGAARMYGESAKSGNVGGGALIRLPDGTGLRIDARDVAFRIPRSGSHKFQHTLAVFVGFSLPQHLGPSRAPARERPASR